MAMNITTPAPPVIDTASPTSGQNIDVSTGAQTFTFTNTASLTGTLVWSYTTSRAGVTINSGSGVLTIAQETYFTVTTFTIQATNPVNISNTRSFTVTTPTPPFITGPTSTGAIVGSRVYVDTASAKTVSIAQTASDTGTITWSGTGSLPTGVTLTTETNALLEFTIGTTAVLRPAGSVFARSNYATNPAGKSSSTISYDVFTPETPALGTPSPAPVSGKIILDTSSTQKTVTVSQTVAAANTDPIIWTYPGIGGVSFSESDTQLVATIPAGTFISDGTSVSVSAKNRANMSSGTTSFTLFAPLIAIFTQLDTQYTNTSASIATFTLSQSRSISANQITYSTSPSAGTLLAAGITYSASGNDLLFSVAQNTIISSGQSITVFGTNGAGVSASTSFTVYAGSPPSLTNPGNFVFDTTTAKSITVTNSGGAIVTWDNPTNFPTGVSFSSSTGSQYTIAVAANSIFGSTSLTVTGKNQYSPTGSSVSFSVAANIKPVVTQPGLQYLDTTTSAQTFTVSQTGGGTGITWSMTYIDGSPIPAAMTLVNPSDTIVTVSIAKTTFLGPSNFKVAATNIAGTTFTENFQITTIYYVAPTISAPNNMDIFNTTPGAQTVTTATVTNSGAAGAVSWSITKFNGSAVPSGVSISGTGDVIYAVSSLLPTQQYTITATNAAGSGSASPVLGNTYIILPNNGGAVSNYMLPAGSGVLNFTLVGPGGNGANYAAGLPGGGGGGGGVRTYQLFGPGSYQSYFIGMTSGTQTKLLGFDAFIPGGAVANSGANAIGNIGGNSGNGLSGSSGGTFIAGGGAGSGQGGYAGSSTSNASSQSAGIGGFSLGTFGAGGGGGGGVKTGGLMPTNASQAFDGGGRGATQGYSTPGVTSAAMSGTAGTGGGGGGGASFSSAGAAGGSGTILVSLRYES